MGLFLKAGEKPQIKHGSFDFLQKHEVLNIVPTVGGVEGFYKKHQLFISL